MNDFKETVAPEVWNQSVEDAWSEWEAIFMLEAAEIPEPSAEDLKLLLSFRKRKAAEAAVKLYQWHVEKKQTISYRIVAENARVAYKLPSLSHMTVINLVHGLHPDTQGGARGAGRVPRGIEVNQVKS